MSHQRIGTAFLIGTAALFTLLLAYSVVTGRPAAQTALFRVVLGGSVLFLVAALRLNDDTRARLALALVTTGAMLLSGEIYFYATENTDEGNPFGKYEAEAKKAGVQFDPLTPTQKIKELRNSGTEIWFGRVKNRLRIGEAVIYHLSYISDATVIGRNELGRYPVLNTDEQGFVNPHGIWGREQIDIVTIGDSFTIADSVDIEKTPAGLIRKVYGNTLNLGMPGGGPLIQLARIKEYLGDVQPRVILWFYWEGNDLWNIMEQLNDPSVPRLVDYLESDFRQDLVAIQPQIDRAQKDFINQELSGLSVGLQKDRSAFGVVTLRRLRARLHHALLNNCEAPMETLTVFERILTDAQRFVEPWGGKIYIVYLPTWERYSSPGRCTLGNGDLVHRDRVLSIAKRVGLPVIDVNEAFDSHPDPLSLFPFRIFGHYNETGYKLVADTVLQSSELANDLRNGPR